MIVSSAPKPKQGGEEIVQRLRAKLWDSGYKLSSKKIEAFLDYIADSTMSESTSVAVEEEEEGDGSSPEAGREGQAIDVNDPGRTHAHVDPTSANARVHKLQQDVHDLEYAIMKYISKNTFPLAVKCPAKYSHAEGPSATHPHNRDPDGPTWGDPDPPSPNTLAGHKKKLPKKSDPVAMFHKMQALWRSDSGIGRKKKQLTTPRASSRTA